MSNQGQPRKVRIACQRCRARRIKCDGRVPACSNCEKAGVSCLDADGRNADQLVPRNFISNAKARIDWLEEVIKTHVPDFDLNQGPSLDNIADIDISRQSPDSESIVANETAKSSKRLFSNLEDPTPEIASEARSVAIDLGMLSLNSDSRERHYLGSSSGLLFANLVQADSPGADRDFSGPGSRRRSRTQSKKPDFQRYHNMLATQLPEKDDALLLFEIYFRHAHADHPVMHPESLFNALNALYSCKNSTAPIHHDGWPIDMEVFSYNGETNLEEPSRPPIGIYTAIFHVFMIFTLAATVTTREGDFEFTPSTFYRVAMSASGDALSETSISSLQAIYLLALHAFMAPAKLNIWTLVHICMAHTIDLGLHREPKSGSEATKLMRRLIFYSVYSLDRSVSAIQGRPLGIRDETFDVLMPEETSIQQDAAQSSMPNDFISLTTNTMPYAIHRFKLDRIVSEIKLLFYHLPDRSSSVQWPTDLITCQRKLRSELDRWFNEVPTVEDKIVLDRSKWRLKLEQLYHAGMVLLFQPSQVFRNPTDEAMLLCFNSAVGQIRCYDELYNQNSLHPGWRPVQSIFACSATIVYCFWTSKAVQQSQAIDSLPDILRVCSTHLSIGGIWWPSLKRGKASFDKLVDITTRRFHEMRVRAEDAQRSRKRQYRGQSASARILNTAQTTYHQPEPPVRLNASTAVSNNNLPSSTEFIHGFDGNPSTRYSTELLGYGNQQQSSQVQSYPNQNFDQEIPNPDFQIPEDQLGFSDPAFDGSTLSSIDQLEPEEVQDFLSGYFDDNYWTFSDASASIPFRFEGL